ncbi:MAG TPA: SDR family NAD(P)-dependent oxidoreductase, partial [Kamptonema sp.]|nr:SDR family NAD(P)-dependent oxidoreductase [Kamptonema sp.]
MDIPPEKLEICLAVLQQISEDPAMMGEHERFKSLIAKIYKAGRKITRLTNQKYQQAEDRQLKETAVIVQNQKSDNSVCNLPSFTENLQHFKKPVTCYICKNIYTKIHFFYHSLCPKCAEFNYQKRYQRTNLNGRIALVTGGRIKIGYQIVLRLLRDGARAIVTTRFPGDCAHRYSLEPDF